MATAVQVKRDWDNDGFLRITGAETLQRYSELCNKQYNIPINKYGLFAAFSKEQFDNGYKGLVKEGKIQDGDRVKRFGNGIFGTLEGMKRWMNEVHDIEDQIRAECDPYEVYLYEYNNYECCIDYDGDERAVEHVLHLYGLERTNEAIYGRRFRECGEIDAIYDNMMKSNNH